MLFSAGCARQGLYAHGLNENRQIVPKIYFVNYEKGFLHALHAVELQSGWRLNYFDKNTGIIEALTPKKDTVTVRVASIDQSTTKIFVFVDSNSYSFNPSERFVSIINQYYQQLDGHLEGIDENS